MKNWNKKGLLKPDELTEGGERGYKLKTLDAKEFTINGLDLLINEIGKEKITKEGAVKLLKRKKLLIYSEIKQLMVELIMKLNLNALLAIYRFSA